MKQRHLGIISATFLGISSIIGSGWLFAPYKAAQVAGPASIYSWIIAAVIISLLALCFAELAGLYPRRGLSAIIPTLSHNRFFGFPFAVSNWLGIVAVIALEATATIQYLINLFPSLQHTFYNHAQLTTAGLALALILIFLFFIINFWGASVLAKTNNTLTILKVLIPIVVAIAVIAVQFHPKNFTIIHHSTTPYGFSSVISAILSTGIIIAFNGFQTVIAFASEVKNPQKTIPYSILYAIVFCLGIYLLLQVAFIGALPTQGLVHHGWRTLSFTAPMVEISSMLGLGIFTTMIYFGATIAPTGTAIAFMGTSSRMFTAMSRNQQMPRYFDRVHPTYGISRRSLIANTLLATLFLVLFRSWSQLAEVLSLFHVIAYLPIPIALWVLRKNIDKNKYPFRVPLGNVIAIALFTLFTLLFTMGNPRTIMNIMVIFACTQIIFITLNVRSFLDLWSSIKQCYLLFIFFAGLLVLSYYNPLHNPHIHATYYYIVACLFTISSFFMLTQTERNDTALITSAVKIYH